MTKYKTNLHQTASSRFFVRFSKSSARARGSSGKATEKGGR